MVVRTELGQSVLESRDRTLGVRERAVLLMANGEHERPYLEGLFAGDGLQIVNRLVEKGYVRPSHHRHQHSSHQPRTQATTHPGQPALEVPSYRAPTAPRRHHKTPAAFRMYLFDLIERSAAPYGNEAANHWRERMRDAQDVDVLKILGDSFVLWLEQHGAGEFAEQVAERIREHYPDSEDEPLIPSKISPSQDIHGAMKPS